MSSSKPASFLARLSALPFPGRNWLIARMDQALNVAGTPAARRFLYGYTALESVIIPIPADPLLVAAVLAQKQRWLQIALWTTLWSVIGGVAGWLLGSFLGTGLFALIEMLPARLAHPIAAEEKFNAVAETYQQLGIYLVFIGAFTPLPYKVIAVSAGLFNFAVLPFILTSLIGRGMRFVLVSSLVRHHRDPKKTILLLSVLAVIVLGSYWLLKGV